LPPSSKTKKRASAKNTPTVSPTAKPATDQPLLLVTPQPVRPTASPQGQQAEQAAAKSKTERPPLVQHKPQTAKTPPARPVVRPRSTARKAPISFPSATATPSTNSLAANGRSLATSLANGQLPVVRTERSQGQAPQSSQTSALPLPKTAVVTPSRAQPAPSLPASAPGSFSSSGVIQRKADDEAPEATNAPAEAVDIDEIVAEVQRQFMRELAIEGERRGVTSWY